MHVSIMHGIFVQFFCLFAFVKAYFLLCNMWPFKCLYVAFIRMKSAFCKDNFYSCWLIQQILCDKNIKKSLFCNINYSCACLTLFCNEE